MAEMQKPDPSRQMKVNRILRKMTRASAYALLAGIAVLILSGWGITQTGVIYKISFGLIDRRLANTIHRAANAPVAFLFILHVMINFRLNIVKRHHVKTWLIDATLIIIGVLLMVIIVYMEYFRLGG